jgi:hypothetical protein
MMEHRRRGASRDERGIAAILLLFALSAFSVLGVAALSTTLGTAPEGKTFDLFRSISRESLTHFVSPLVIPNDWLAQGAGGSFQFQLPIVVPETGGEDGGSTSAWHEMSEVPGLAVCCESRDGTCARQRAADGLAIEEWTPGASDALRLSFDVSSRPDEDAAKGDRVTATVSTAPAVPADASTIACHLAFDGQIIAHGTASLAQSPRPEGSLLNTALVNGTMALVVRTR